MERLKEEAGIKTKKKLLIHLKAINELIENILKFQQLNL